MTPDSFKLYTDKLNSIREGLTEPNKIKFIDDIFEALKYKDSEREHLNKELSRIVESNMQLRTERDKYLKQRNFYHSILDKLQLSLVTNNDTNQSNL